MAPTVARLTILVLLLAPAARTAAAQEFASGSAQEFTVLHAFTEAATLPVGRLVEGPAASYYGVSTEGGAFDEGTVFVLRQEPDLSWRATTLHSFYRPTGALPRAGLVRANDGNFYGPTMVGGAADLGSIYRITPDGVVTTVRTFSAADGRPTTAPLTLASDGSLLGTLSGGASGVGSAYRITTAGAFTIVHQFTAAEGTPQGGLTEGFDGAFYGVKGSLLELRAAEVFRMTASGVVTTVRTFGFLESLNAELLLASDGALYGTTAGGLAGAGSVFRLTLAGERTEIHAFAGGADGRQPETGLIEVGGVYYGTTSAPGSVDPAQRGTVYRVDANGNFATLATFTAALGRSPAGLLRGSDGFLYGIAESGGATPAGDELAAGTAFRLPLTGPAELLWTFASDLPARPIAGLVEGAPGEFYGVSCTGGWFGDGSLFKVSPAGLSSLHSFMRARDGACPFGRLVRGPDGNLYGATVSGGPGFLGAIFKLAATGAVTVLHAFQRDTAGFPVPIGELVFGGDGHIYGARSNLLDDSGLIFRLASDGTYSTLHRIQSTLFGGIRIVSGLAAGGDGNFYGTTFSRGAFGANSSLFRVTPDGAFTVLQNLDASGVFTFSRLLAGSDGALYGNAPAGGSSGAGVTFRSTLAGSVSPLHSFSFLDGSGPLGDLVEGPDGALYGATFGCEDWRFFQFGTIFRLDAAGHHVLHRFNWLNGSNPSGGLTLGSDGAFYGTTLHGGPGGRGVVFRLRP